jgi:hypothetical protein
MTINYSEFMADITGEHAELKFFESLMLSHADWAHSGLGGSLAPTAMGDVLHINKRETKAKGILNLPEDIILAIDRALAKQPERFQRILMVEYLYTSNDTGGFASQEYKARQYFRIKRDLYRVRLTAAELCMINSLRPAFDEWMRLYEVKNLHRELTVADSVC